MAQGAEKTHLSPMSRHITLRRGWDSNPRKPCGFSGFQDRRIRPLCHPSESYWDFDLCRAEIHLMPIFDATADARQFHSVTPTLCIDASVTLLLARLHQHSLSVASSTSSNIFCCAVVHSTGVRIRVACDQTACQRPSLIS